MLLSMSNVNPKIYSYAHVYGQHDYNSHGTELLNPLYEVPSYACMLKHIEIFKKYRPSPAEAINNVYELPSIKPAIRYLHGAARFPTKANWLKAIRNGGYLSWPLVNIKNVNKHFPESEKTQKGHMRNQQQRVRSTKTHRPKKTLLHRTQNPQKNPYKHPF